MTTSILQTISFQGRTALITGAAGHIGSQICYFLAELGADILLVDQHAQKLELLAAELQAKFSIDASVFTLDLESEQERQSLVVSVQDHLQAQQKTLSVLINNAAFVGDSKLGGWVEPFALQTIDTWRRALEVNLTAVFHLCQQFAPQLASGSLSGAVNSSIINIGSIYGHCPPDWSLYEGTSMGNPAAYAASKAGLHGLTTWLSSTLAPAVRVNTIAPSGVWRGQPDIFVERYLKTRPLGRMLTESDVAQACVLYASDIMSAVTGEVVML